MEVRKNSLTLLWKPPVYQGRDEVNGYYIDIKEAEADFECWRSVNEKACPNRYIKVAILNLLKSYILHTVYASLRIIIRDLLPLNLYLLMGAGQ